MQAPAHSHSKVAVVSCDSYDRETVRAAVRRAISLMGGLSAVARPDETILVKPNALVGAHPDRCITTHPSVFGAVCECLAEHGCRVTYGDSPALYEGWGRCEGALRKAGFAAAAEELGIGCADFANGKQVKNAGSGSHRLFVIANGVLAADGVVSLPKLKTHGLTRITGAIKNQYGCVPGAHKGQYHAAAPDVHGFSRLLAAITAFIKPRLYVMDAVIAMEGNGPMNGSPRKVGAILASCDPVALDTVACRLVNLDPRFVPTLAAGEEWGLGTADSLRIDIVGDGIKSLAVRDFRVTRNAPLVLPEHGAARFIRSAVVSRPVISAGACTRCGACVRACPVKPAALEWGPAGAKRPPVYKYGRCIRCYCCHEICPSGAIRVATPPAGRLLPFVSYLSIVISNARARRRERKAGSSGGAR
jgi:uncharacterized protein (DUF362 family)/Pyruvate/2-oxoacid:ferredoxin oxidoreductase delta subunit